MRKCTLLCGLSSCLLLGGCVWSLDLNQSEKDAISTTMAPVVDAANKLLPLLGSAGGFVLGGPAGAAAGSKVGETLAYGLSAATTAIAGAAAMHASKKSQEAEAAKGDAKAARAEKIAADASWDLATATANAKA